MPGYEEIFFGGVTALHPADFEAANGYPNDYWGWGAEDDQLRLRVEASGGLKRGVARPPAGAGRYRDLDQMQMLSLLQTRESTAEHAHRFNQHLFRQDRRAARELDEQWRGANGLRGMRYEALSRAETAVPSAGPAPVVSALHVVARLGE